METGAFRPLPPFWFFLLSRLGSLYRAAMRGIACWLLTVPDLMVPAVSDLFASGFLQQLDHF